jgi:acetoin utilization deacetylase AcuC-like enzyme
MVEVNMETNGEVQDLKLKVGLLEKDVDQITVLCDKLDTTIEKVQELTSTMTKMLALHEERIEKQEQKDAELIVMVEKRRTETEANIKELHSRITTTDRENAKEMSDLEDRMEKMLQAHTQSVVAEVKKLEAAQRSHHEEMSQRLRIVEQKTWMFVGAAVVIGYILANASPLIQQIFG